MRKRTNPTLRAALRRVALGAQTAERAYVREIRGILRGVHTLMLSHVEAAGRRITGDALGKGSGNPMADIENVTRTVLPQIPGKVRKAHDKMSSALDRNYRSNMAHVMPVTLAKLDPAVQQAAINARDASIVLVENAARVYAQQVREIFERPEWTIGKRWEDLRDELLERAEVSESRAELIARDQTLKLNGAINKARQEGAGIDSYTWSTSGDERVRDEHAALNGEVFAWSNPPDPGHPGEDFQCRCIAIPVIDLSE